MKIAHFPKIKGRVTHSEDIRGIIPKIAHFVDTGLLPTDFTRLRRMAKRRGILGKMSKGQAAAIGVALKFIEIE